LLAFMSDHGDHLGQHGMYQKMEMYEQAIRVPMMFAGPSCLARTVDLPVSHLDVLPTILDLLGLDAAEETDGLSLAPAVRGEARPPERLIFSQYSGNPAPGDLRRCVIDGAFKYIWSQPGGRELYDLGADPLEMDNLAARGEYAPMVERLHRECLRWAEEHQDHAFLNQTAR
jgi:arylsulfatase A-like enzyme